MEMIKMKKILNSGIIALCLVFSGCDWLDINPETGLDETEVFTIWDNYKAYFDYVYGSSVANSERNTNIKQGYPLYLDNWSLRFTWLAMTDMCDTGRLIRAQSIKAGTLGANVEVFTTDLTRRPVSYSMFKIIRICNKAIGNIDRVQNIPSEQDKNDILGQAYFVRGFAHFVLCRYFGGMPYLDKALGSEDNWDQTGSVPMRLTGAAPRISSRRMYFSPQPARPAVTELSAIPDTFRLLTRIVLTVWPPRR